jgi:endonuclease-3
MSWNASTLKDLLSRLDAAYPDARCALEHSDPFQLVVATILSAQCTDVRVNLVTPALFAKYPTPHRLAQAIPAELEGLIHSTGFFRNKARNLIGLGQALVERHGGRVPSDPKALAALPGVGQKTANVVLANAFGIPALAVDTHIFRVAKRLALSAANTPEKVEADLCRQFPEALWIPLHHQLIWHGRRTCDARRPHCEDCTLRDLCPTGSGGIEDPHSGKRFDTLKPPPPMRIVSLVPSLTELLARWGLEERLVGRTRYCVEPRRLQQRVPAVGGTKDPDLAQIRALTPDLVLLERDENTFEAEQALRDAGLRTHVLDIRTVRGAAEALVELGERLGAPNPGRAESTRILAQLKKRRRKGPLTATLVWREPWILAGPDTYVSDLVRQAGFEPLGPEGYPRLTLGALEALAPEVILLPTEPFRFTTRHRIELQKRFPDALVRIVEGRAVTWFLSRTGEGLDLLRDPRNHLTAAP